MFTFFDYLYYKVCNFYKKREGGTGYRFSGLLVISAMYGFNLLSVLFLVQLVIRQNIDINKFQIIIFAVVLVILNGIRYNKYDYEMLKKRWENEGEKGRIKKQKLVVLYIIFSTLLFFGLAIFLGSKK
jgi:dolichol kinase